MGFKVTETRSAWAYSCAFLLHYLVRGGSVLFFRGRRESEADEGREGWSHAEARLFVAGCWMLVAWLFGIGVLWRLEDPLWLNTLTLGFTTLFLGRAAAVAQALQAEVSPAWIVFLTTYVDVVTVFVAYPALVLSYRSLFERPFVQRHVTSVFKAAEKGLGRFSHFKVLGVFLFVWFPFWGTGVVVGAVLGYLLNLPVWLNMATVVLGTMTAVSCWVLAYDRLFTWLGGIHEVFPLVSTAVLIAALVVFRLAVRMKKRRAERRRNGEEVSA